MKSILTLFSLLIAFTACDTNKEPEIKNEATADKNAVQLTAAQMKNAGVVTGKMEQKNISSILKVNGIIDVPPQNMVSISIPLGGYLKSTQLLPGMHLNKGESIAVMEDQQYIQLQQDYLITKAKLLATTEEYKRQEELNKSKASSDKVFQQAKSDYSSQKVMLKSLSEKLKLIGIDPENLNENNISRSITITSPIDGYVSKVNANIGKYAKPEDVLFEIVNPADIHLALHIFEKDINKLYIGQKLIAYTNNDPEKKYPCETILIGKDFGQDRSVEVHCHFDNYDKILIPGMYMNAEIEIKSNSAYALPAEAIVSFENKKYIFLEKRKNGTDGYQYEMTEIKTGNTENGFTEIISVAKEQADEIFVTKGAYSLLMKMKNTPEE